MARSRSLAAVPAAALLLMLLVVAAVGVAAKTTVHDVTEGAGSKEDESWTDWAKDKITEGLGLKHVDEEEAARKAGHTAKSARETAQHAADGKKIVLAQFNSSCRAGAVLMPTVFTIACRGGEEGGGRQGYGGECGVRRVEQGGPG